MNQTLWFSLQVVVGGGFAVLAARIINRHRVGFLAVVAAVALMPWIWLWLGGLG